MHITRWPSSNKGRSREVACGELVWTVANAKDKSVDFDTQATQSLQMLESNLIEAGSARTHLLSVQVMLADIAHRDAFDRLWQEWIGDDPAHWPQRACFQSVLAPGLLIELVAVAASASAQQRIR
jgi:enamine deaminase RidA (YjgF/YER057c/UK114 family)